MKLRIIITIFAACTLLTACLPIGNSDSTNDTTQNISVGEEETQEEKEDLSDEEKEEYEKLVAKAKEIVITGSGELTEDMVKERLLEEGIEKYDEESDELYRIVIEDGFTKIGSFAFKGYKGLCGVSIPDSVTELGGCVFEDCSALIEITIPDSVTEMGNATFWNCTNLQEVKLSEGLTELDTTFMGCHSLKTVEIPSSVTFLDGTFKKCNAFETFIVPEGVTELRKTFQNCTSLQKVVLPESITKIDGYTFSGCSALAEVNIPDNVELISEEAFLGCTSLEFEQLNVMGMKLGANAFTGIKIKELIVDGKDSCVSGFALDEAIIEKVTYEIAEDNDKLVISATLKVNPATLKEIVISDGYIQIRNNMFEGYAELESVTIPASVTEIGPDVFKDCGKVTIYTTAGSTAETYAIENGISYEIIQ